MEEVYKPSAQMTNKQNNSSIQYEATYLYWNCASQHKKFTLPLILWMPKHLGGTFLCFHPPPASKHTYPY